MTIKQDTGNVGIGTSSPSSNLEVAGDTTGNVQITIDNANTGGLGTFTLQENGSTTGIFQYRGSNNGTLPNTVRVGSNVAGGSLAFTYAGGTTGMYIKGSDGNVGIGTTSPSQALDVAGSINLTGDIFLAQEKEKKFSLIRAILTLLQTQMTPKTYSYQLTKTYS